MIVLYLLIGLVLSLLILYITYKLFESSTFGVVFLFNVILDVISTYIKGTNDSFLMIIIISIIAALITTLIQKIAYKKSTSFIKFILWLLLFGFILALILAGVAFVITYFTLNSIQDKAKDSSRESTVQSIQASFKTAYLTSTYQKQLDNDATEITDEYIMQYYSGIGTSSGTTVTFDDVECTLKNKAVICEYENKQIGDTIYLSK